MPSEELFFRRVVVFASALVYWAGVLVQARRVRRHIGKSPNLRPRGLKEKLLWIGWFLVIVAWVGQPFVAGSGVLSPALRFASVFLHPLSFVIGLILVVAGYAGTVWCYAAMGDTWRIGIHRTEQTRLVTRGPYRRVRHPIYAFQVVMLAGVALLLPTFAALAVLVLHFLCVLIKASDEENYLRANHGKEYQEYLARTGRLFPKLIPKTSEPG